jgi:ATP-binding cassette subfamily B protein
MIRDLYRLLRNHLGPYKVELVLVLVFQALQTVATLWLPSLNAQIIDQGVVTGDTGFIWSRGAVMLAVAFAQVVFAVLAVYYGSRAAMGLGRDVRTSLFHSVNGYSAQEVAHFGPPSLITRITNDVQQVQMLVQMSCTMLVAAPMMIVGGVIMALREDAQLSGILLVAVPVMVLLIGLVVSRMVPQFTVMQTRIDRLNQVLREQITGIRVVRAFVREPDEEARFGETNQLVTGAALYAGRLQAFMFPMVLLVLNLSSAAAVWFGAHRIADGQLQIGQLIAFLSYLIQILMALLMVTFMVVLVPRAAVCADRIQDVLETPTTVADPLAPVTELVGTGALRFDGVGFKYPGAEESVVTGVSFTVRPGETTAVVGSTGSGKTTLLSLVPRLFDVTEGSVLVDGVDVREMSLSTLRARIGLVPQRPYLFSGTVRSNLLQGDSSATDEQLWAALEVAQAADFVRAMPDGLDAPVEQGGTNVSGGQRQRLAIARALVRRPSIYLFDDSFSALDLATDARLRAALAPITRDAAVLVVAQRVSTIVSADQIVVLEDGVAVGTGTHKELLATCPTYAEIVASQMGTEDVA